MLRPVPSLLAILVAMAASPAVAADYWEEWGGDDDVPDFRTTYPTDPGDWAGLGDYDDPLHFEFGARYWYSMGNQSFAINSGLAGDPGTVSSQDTSHITEGHLKISDDSTNTFAKAIAGYGVKTDGTGSSNLGTVDITNGNIGYLGADLTWNALGDNNNGIGPTVGYLYWNNSPNDFSDSFATATTSEDLTYDQGSGQTSFGGDSVVNDIHTHALRLGFSTNVDLGGFIDFSADVAAVPYAKVQGTLGAGSGFALGHNVVYDNPSGYGPVGLTGAYNIHDVQSSATSVDGWGYGAMAQGFVGIRPAENFVFRLGARAWYLQGTTDVTFSRATISDPSDSSPPVAPIPADPGDPNANPPIPAVPAVPGDLNPPNFDTPPVLANQNYISRANPFAMFRYGLLAELTYKF